MKKVNTAYGRYGPQSTFTECEGLRYVEMHLIVGSNAVGCGFEISFVALIQKEFIRQLLDQRFLSFSSRYLLFKALLNTAYRPVMH